MVGWAEETMDDDEEEKQNQQSWANESLSLGWVLSLCRMVVPELWKTSCLVPVPKKKHPRACTQGLQTGGSEHHML